MLWRRPKVMRRQKRKQPWIARACLLRKLRLWAKDLMTLCFCFQFYTVSMSQAGPHSTVKRYELAENFFALAEQHGTTIPLMVGNRQMGAALSYSGEIARGRAHFDEALILYDPAKHRNLVTRFGQDVRVAILFQRSLSLWLLGIPPLPFTRMLRTHSATRRNRSRS